ncbi:oligosaccharide flippase family protein [Polaribacter sp. OB-PA-B3]
MDGNKKIISNTIITYLKSLITIVISLVTTRYLLDYLGQSDYGLFNVVAGVVFMLAFLNTTMANATQRFLSFNINNKETVNKLYNSSFVIHFIIAVLFIFFIEVVGVYMVNNQLNIDLSRLEAANVLIQIVAVSTFFVILSIPVEALIISKENFKFLAISSTLEVILKFIAVLCLLFVNHDKRLVFYGLLLALLTVFIKVLKFIYLHWKYKYVKINFSKFFDKNIIKELTSFAGWNLFGSLSTIGKNQGLTIIYNLFFNTSVNAAYAVATQISSQLLFFSRTLMQTIRPQMASSEGEGDRVRLMDLIFKSCKFSFMLTAFVVIPFLFESKSIYRFWLGDDYPNYTELFTFFILINILLYQLTIGIHSGIQSIGKIKNYQITVGVFELLALPVSYLFFSLGYPVVFGMIFYTLSEIAANTTRIIVIKKLTNFNLKNYFAEVLYKQIIPVFSSIITCYVVVNIFDFKYRFILTICLSITVFVFTVYYYSFNKEEKFFVKQMFSKISNKISNKMIN